MISCKGEMPKDIAVDELETAQMRDLERLKEWIYRTRVRARHEKNRDERNKDKVKEYRAERQGKVASQEILQSSLFDL